EAVAEQADDPVLRRAITLARGRLGEGEPLARALGASPRVFSALYCDLVSAGEASGALPTVLERLAEHTEAAAAVRARLRAALTYPLVMTGATGLVLAFLLVWVVPQVAQLFADTGTPLPLATRALLGLVSVARATWWLALLLALAAALGRTGAFPSLLVRLAAVGERGGSLATSLERAARSYEAEVDAAVSAATALLEPLLIVAMGGVVLLLVVAVLVPIFALNQVVR